VSPSTAALSSSRVVAGDIARRCRTLIQRSAKTLKLSSQRMPSGAGHDAQMMAQLVPMGMIFLPSSEQRKVGSRVTVVRG
jgi:acetylornithine deacetylase/succinyl-diaminopimelate desuccinylase-like protein